MLALAKVLFSFGVLHKLGSKAVLMILRLLQLVTFLVSARPLKAASAAMDEESREAHYSPSLGTRSKMLHHSLSHVGTHELTKRKGPMRGAKSCAFQHGRSKSRTNESESTLSSAGLQTWPQLSFEQVPRDVLHEYACCDRLRSPYPSVSSEDATFDPPQARPC